jgi:hypothetical protein
MNERSLSLPAALIAFLASEETPYITRHPVIIDGGEIAGGLASR